MNKLLIYAVMSASLVLGYVQFVMLTVTESTESGKKKVFAASLPQSCQNETY